MRTKRTAREVGDVGVALGHVAEAALERDAVGRDVAAEDARGAGVRAMEAEEGGEQRRLAGAVGAEEADDAARQLAAQPGEDGAAAEADLEPVELEERRRRRHSRPTRL